MRLAFCGALLVLAGCFAEVRGAVLAPTRHGYGGWGGQLVGNAGVFRDTSWGRVGGGVMLGGFTGTDPVRSGFELVGGGVHLRNEITLKRIIDYLDQMPISRRRIVSLTTVSVGLAQITSDPSQATAVVDVLSGIGYSNDRRIDRGRWDVYCLGVAANRLWPELSDGVWFIGLAVSGGFGWDPRHSP